MFESGETFFKPSGRTVLFYYNKDQVLPFHDCKGIFIGGLTFCEHVFLFTIFPGLFLNCESRLIKGNVLSTQNNYIEMSVTLSDEEELYLSTNSRIFSCIKFQVL